MSVTTDKQLDERDAIREKPQKLSTERKRDREGPVDLE